MKHGGATLSGKEAIRIAMSLSTAHARTLARETDDATLRRVCTWRCDEPEAFLEIVELSGLESPAVTEAVTTRDRREEGGRARPVQDQMLVAFKDQWRSLSEVGLELGKTTIWVSRAMRRTAKASGLVVERRCGRHGWQLRLVAITTHG